MKSFMSDLMRSISLKEMKKVGESLIYQENEIVETLDDDIWDAGYDTDSLNFLLPSQGMSRDNIIN